MNETKNILIGKLGKKFSLKKFNNMTGDDASVILFSKLALLNSNYKFYIAGPNDINKLTPEEYDKIFPNHNVFTAPNIDLKVDNPYDCLDDYFDNIKIDFALIINGPTTQMNVANFVRKGFTKDGDFYKPLMMFKRYVGPYVYVLNKLGCPFYLISEDARYITTWCKDLWNHERLIFTQTNGNFKIKKHIKSIDDWTMVENDKVEAIYSGVERIFMMGLDKNWKSNIDIEHKLSINQENNQNSPFIVISNGCSTFGLDCGASTKISRLSTYKEYILDNFKDDNVYNKTKIYGNWSDEDVAQYPDKILNIPVVELQDQIRDAKYSIAYSQQPGFVTVKAWELIILGLVPFIHPDYDKDRLLGFPEYVYLKSPEDLLNKIHELDANPELYKDIMKQCQDCIKPEYLDGSDLNNRLLGTIAKDLGFEYKPKKGIENTLFDHFNKDVII